MCRGFVVSSRFHTHAVQHPKQSETPAQQELAPDAASIVTPTAPVAAAANAVEPSDKLQQHQQQYKDQQEVDVPSISIIPPPA